MGTKPRTPEFYPKMRWRARSRISHQVADSVARYVGSILNIEVERTTRGHAGLW